jgi:hypothetical protein
MIQGGFMKVLTVLMTAGLSLNAFAILPDVVEAPIDHVFVPNGFDNNDHVEIVVTGKFPNPCYTRNKYDVKIKNDVIKIDVTSLSMDDPAYTKCEPLKIPFTEVVDLGSLQGGDYKIIVNEGGKYEQKDGIVIATSSSDSIDDNIYAMVDYIETGFTGGASGDAMLVAQSPSPCLVLDRVEYLSNDKDALSVLPIMKKISSNCPEKRDRIEIPIKFDPTKFKFEQILLFVRTIEGRSVNTFISK